jgi:DNA-binding CsgD family transcriptional regulator
MDHVPTGENRCIEYCLINRALDGMCIGLVTVDTAGRLSWANRAALRVLGTRLSASEGQPFASLIRDPQLAAFWHEASDAAEGLMGEVSVHWPRPAQLKANVTHCFDRNGERIGRALLFCDLTAEKTVQLELSKETTERLLCMAGIEVGEDPGITASLTPQEIRVLRLVGQGLSNEDIAHRMFVAPSTIRSHLKHVYRKTGLKTRAEAVRFANRNGFD